MTQDSPSGSSHSNDPQLELEVLVKVDGKPRAGIIGIPVMVSVTAPTGLANREPVNIVVVLHMDPWFRLPVYWRELLIKAVELIIENLDDHDVCAIHPVHPTSAVMSNEGKREIIEALRSKEIQENITILEHLDRAAKLTGFGDKMHVIILISNSNVDFTDMRMINNKRSFRDIDLFTAYDGYLDFEDTTARITGSKIHSFGIHGTHNAKTMERLARIHGGSYALLNDEQGRITEAFVSCVNSLTSVAVGSTLVEISNSDSFSSQPSDDGHSFLNKLDDHWLKCYISGINRGTKRSMILYLSRERRLKTFLEDNAKDVPRLFRAELTCLPQYGDARPFKFECTLDKQVVAVRKGDPRSKEMAVEIVRREAIKIVSDIIKRYTYTDEIHKAADELRVRWALLRDSDAGQEAGEADLISRLAEEMQEMETRLRSNYGCLEYMLSWRSHHLLQQQPPRRLLGDCHPDVSPFQLVRILAEPQVVGSISRPSATGTRQGLPVQVRLVTPPAAGTTAVQRAAVDLVAVLDVAQKPTDHNRLELLLKAIELVMEKLRDDNDRLAILPVHSPASRPTGLFEMSVQGRSDTSAMVRALLSVAPAETKSEGTSQRKEPLKKAVQKFFTSSCFPITPELQRASEKTTRCLADSDSNGSGRTKLWKALTDAMEMLDGRQAEDMDRVGIIMLISDGGVDSSFTIQRTLSPSYAVHALGFRAAHDATALQHIATSSGGGIYAVLNEEDHQLSDAFLACIDRITSVVASQAQVDIKCSDWSNTTLSIIESGQLTSFISRDKKLGHIMVGNLHSGTVHDFSVYLDNVRDNHIPGWLTARVSYMAGGWMETAEHQVDLLLAEYDSTSSVHEADSRQKLKWAHQQQEEDEDEVETSD